MSAATTSWRACGATSTGTRGATPRCTDLLAALEETSGRDLASWSKEWLETAGVNTLRPAFELDADGNFTVVRRAAGGQARATRRCARTASRSACTTATDGRHRPARAGRARRRSAPRTEVPAAGRRDAPGPRPGQRRRPHLRQDPARRALAAHPGRRHRRDHRRACPRALCWSAAWDMTRDAEMATRDYVRLVADGRPRRHRHLGDADAAAAGPPRRPAVRRPGLARGGPEAAGRRPARPGPRGRARLGPPARLHAGVRRHGRHRRAPGRSSKGCWTARQALDGLTVDTDLRWALLRRLVVTGKAGEAEIDAEHERDRDRRGRAARRRRARAAIPTAEAKAAAWERDRRPGELPNAVFRATLGGFVEPDQADLLVPYVDKYFARGRAHLGRVEQRHVADVRRGRLPVPGDRAVHGRPHRGLHRGGAAPAGAGAGCCRRAATASPARCAPARRTRPPPEHGPPERRARLSAGPACAHGRPRPAGALSPTPVAMGSLHGHGEGIGVQTVRDVLTALARRYAFGDLAALITGASSWRGRRGHPPRRRGRRRPVRVRAARPRP